MMRVLITTILFHLACCSLKLTPRFEWKRLEYSKLEDDTTYLWKQNIPTGIDVYKDKLFVTVPRWNDKAVPSTLNYVSLKDNSTSPKLIPYPTLEETSTLKSAVSIRVDRCDRLWVLDCGKIDDPVFTAIKSDLSPSILVYNLKNDKEEKKYPLPMEQFEENSYFSSIEVEENNCTDTYAYIGDASNGKIIVYSFAQNKAWIKTHKNFKSGDDGFNYGKFNVPIKILDTSISKPNSDGFSTLFLHPIASKYIFSISTRYLRNESIDISDRKSNYVQALDTRDFSSASFLDQNSGILFYSLVNSDGIACWNTKKEYKNETQGLVYSNKITMVYPADLKVDSEDNLWILTNKMPELRNQAWDSDSIKFRIFSIPVSDAIKDTVCEIKNPVSSAAISRTSNTIWKAVVMVYLLKMLKY